MANVVFPAFSTPFFTALFFPLVLLAVLIIESTTYKLASKTTPLFHIVLLVIVANGISWIAGAVITAFMPSGIIVGEDNLATSGPNFLLYATLGYLVAYILSVIIEGYIVKASKSKMNFTSPFKLSFYANTVSYITLIIILWAYDSFPL